MEKLRVLLVDDETLVRKSLKKLLPLEEFSMEVAGEASNGENALMWLRENQADIVIVDLSMPVMDGFELLQHINSEYPGITKIVLTCHAEVRMIQQAIAENISGYILKTEFDMEENRKLLSRIRKKALQSRVQKSYDILLVDAAEETCRRLEAQHASILHLPENVAIVHAAQPADELLKEEKYGIAMEVSSEQARRIRNDKTYAAELIDRYLAYERQPQKRIYTLARLPDVSDAEVEETLNQVACGEWLLNVREKRDIQKKAETLRIPVSPLSRRLMSLISSIDCILPPAGQHASPCLCKGRVYWTDVRIRMDRLFDQFQKHMKEREVSQNVTGVLLHAIFLLQEPKILFGKAENLAALVGFSRSHFSRCFSQLMGMSVRSYMQTMRIRYVKDMLEQGVSIAETAQKLGYINEEYFRKLYNIELNKQQTGE